MTQASVVQHPVHAEDTDTRRDFLFLLAGAMGAIGTGASIWPLVDSMNPAADVRAVSTTEIDIAPIAAGQRITVIWRGNPVFIDHRTPGQIAQALADDNDSGLIDPASDSSRVQREDWLVVVGVCTHLGCIPLGQKSGSRRGDWGGWFCPCHGSHYDTSGRIRKGPAPKNLIVPPYELLENDIVRIG